MSLLVGLFSGCIIPIPPADTGYARQNLKPKNVDQIEPGKTTIAEVILLMGEPDAVSPDERKLAYRSERIVAIWFVGGGYSAASDALTHDRYLLVELDAGGVVQSRRLSSPWLFPTTPARLMETDGWKAAGMKEEAEISGPAFWFPDIDGFAELAFEPEKHARGFLALTVTAIQFRDRTQTDNSAPSWRVPYEALTECRLAKFGLARRVVVRTRSHEVHSFEFEKNKLNDAACRLIQTRIPPHNDLE